MKSAAEVAARLRIEGHDHGAVQPGRRQQAQLVALARELEQRVLRPQEQPRVRREGQRRRLALERAGALERGADHRAVAAVHAVEIADRQHGALQRPDIERLRAVARDMERFRGQIGLFMRRPGGGRRYRSQLDSFGSWKPYGHAYGYRVVNKVSN